MPCPALPWRGARHGSEPGAEQCPCGTGQVPWHRAQHGSGAAGLCQRLCQALPPPSAGTSSELTRTLLQKVPEAPWRWDRPAWRAGSEDTSARHRDAPAWWLPARPRHCHRPQNASGGATGGGPPAWGRSCLVSPVLGAGAERGAREGSAGSAPRAMLGGSDLRGAGCAGTFF